MDSDELVQRFASGAGGTHLFESTPQRKARKDTRQRTGRNLQYKLGEEGRKTGVKRKENVRKDADDLDNVEDFFHSDDEEDPDESLDMPIGEASPIADLPSPSDMSLASSRQGEASPFERELSPSPSPPPAKKQKSKKQKAKRQERMSVTPVQERRSSTPTPTPAPDFGSLDEDSDDLGLGDDDVPAYDFNDSSLADLPGEPYFAPLNDSVGDVEMSEDDEVSFFGSDGPPADDMDTADEDDDENEAEAEDDDDEDDARSRTSSVSTKSSSEYAQLRVQDLRDLCKERGFSYSGLSKKQMIKKLRREASSTPRRSSKPKKRTKPVSSPRETPDSEEEDFSIQFGSDEEDEDEFKEDESIVLNVADVSTWGSNRLKGELRRLKEPVDGSREQLAKRLAKALRGEALSSMSGSTPSGKSKKRKRSDLFEPSPDNWGLPAKRITRRPPLAFWKNEHVTYGRRQSGNFATVIDIVENDEVGSPPRKKVKLPAPAKKKTVVVPPGSVYKYDEDKQMRYRVVKSEDMLRFRPLVQAPGAQCSSTLTTSNKEGKLVSSDVEVAYAFNEGNALSCGVIKIGPRESTSAQNSSLSMEVFYVIAGTLDVKISQSVFTVKRGYQFFVPPENRFTIFNTSNRTARLYFFRTMRPVEGLTGDEDRDEKVLQKAAQAAARRAAKRAEESEQESESDDSDSDA